MKKLKNTVLLFLLVMSSQVGFAQEEFEDDVPDVPTASIEEPIILAALTGIIIGYKMLKTKKAI